MEVYDVVVIVESDDEVMTGVIVVVDSRLEVISCVEDTLHVEIEAVIEETVADPDDDGNVDTTVFNDTEFGVKDEVTVATDKTELGT
jgi:hypothetical protein